MGVVLGPHQITQGQVQSRPSTRSDRKKCLSIVFEIWYMLYVCQFCISCSDQNFKPSKKIMSNYKLSKNSFISSELRIESARIHAYGLWMKVHHTSKVITVSKFLKVFNSFSPFEIRSQNNKFIIKVLKFGKKTWINVDFRIMFKSFTDNFVYAVKITRYGRKNMEFYGCIYCLFLHIII